jgi:hypothetical protein
LELTVLTTRPFHRQDEKYFIQGDCPNCGAKNKDIQAWYDGQYEEKKVSHEERVKRMRTKDARLPTRIRD